MERLQTKARSDGEGFITKATAWRGLASFRAVIAKAVKWACWNRIQSSSYG